MDKYFNFDRVDPNPLKYDIKINVSLSFTFYKYCIEPIDMINKIIKSKVYSIGISSIHDFVPSIIKTKKYFNILRKLKFLRCSSRNNIINQIIEVNYILYNKYFSFHKKHKLLGNRMLFKFNHFYKVGIHVRLSDNCLKSCNVSKLVIYNIVNISKQYSINNTIIILSSFSKSFSKTLSYYVKNLYTYAINNEVKHSFYSKNVTQNDVDKIVVDIYLTSNSDILLLSGISTYSLLILYHGYYKNYKKCIPKKYIFWAGGELYDHLNRFRRKKNCINFDFL